MCTLVVFISLLFLQTACNRSAGLFCGLKNGISRCATKVA